jgi:hypothetical protein
LLEGVGGGTLSDGEERACDHAHGAPGSGAAAVEPT